MILGWLKGITLTAYFEVWYRWWNLWWRGWHTTPIGWVICGGHWGPGQGYWGVTHLLSLSQNSRVVEIQSAIRNKMISDETNCLFIQGQRVFYSHLIDLLSSWKAYHTKQYISEGWRLLSNWCLELLVLSRFVCWLSWPLINLVGKTLTLHGETWGNL